MAPSEIKRKEASHPRHRSHRGCWTCKRKRIQCDETRPGCHRCTSRGLTCEGYEIRLRWGAGIASRGKFNGAEKPVKESIPPPSKRRWDLRSPVDREQQGQPVLLHPSMSTEDNSYTAEVHPLDQPATERATVNILNTPYEQDPHYLGIIKHFELPVSMERLERTEPGLCNGNQPAPTQYSDNQAGRPTAIASL